MYNRSLLHCIYSYKLCRRWMAFCTRCPWAGRAIRRRRLPTGWAPRWPWGRAARQDCRFPTNEKKWQMPWLRGCRTFLRKTYQHGKKYNQNHKIYQMTTIYTKWPQYIPNGHKIYQFAVKKQMVRNLYQQLQLHEPPKFTQIGIFGLKQCHLATLLLRHSSRNKTLPTHGQGLTYVVICCNALVKA
jgi:hypothetical protein